MESKNLTPYLSARATPQIVNRDKILDQIKDAIADTSDITYVFYITAPGGWGKTRLVEEVLYRLQETRPDAPRRGEWYSPDVLAASRPVDLYHMYTHSEEGLTREMYDALAPGPRHFTEYIQQRDRLERYRYDVAEILREVTRQRERTIGAFIDDFNRLKQSYRRTVLALDTAETLVYETDRVQQALGLAEQPLGVAAWLINEFLSKVNNAVVLIAGRTESPRLAEDLRRVSNIRLIEYPLEPFNETESLKYFEAMTEAARREGNSDAAARIENIPKETRQVIHLYSGGEPLLLALMLDYLAVADELIPEVRVPLDEAIKRTSAPEGCKQVQGEIKTAIVQRILETRRPSDVVIRALALTPKGMDAELLACLLRLRPASDEEVKEAQSQLDALSKPRLSFIKIRPKDNRVFLHDEMYDMLRENVYDALPPPTRDKVDRTIRVYCAQKVEKARERVQELETRELEVAAWVPGRPSEWAAAPRPTGKVKPEELFEARAELQNRQVDEVYYALRQDMPGGFELYYRYADEATFNNDESLRLQLRDQILKFCSSLKEEVRTGTGVLRPTDVERDVGLRWIKSNVYSGKHEIALQQITRFREHCKDLILAGGPLAEAEIDVWEGWALTESGQELDRAEKLLSEAIGRLDKMTTPTLSRARAYQVAQAFAHAQLGYLRRIRGLFQEAVKGYKQSLPFWREANLPALHAMTLNNLAWALAEVGDFEAALMHCEDGLRMRQKMGRRYSIALSLNTLGLIETKNDQADRGMRHCKLAWDIFRELEQPRGVGLASIALAESLRRVNALPSLVTPQEAIENLWQGEKYAREAVRIFTEDIKEPLRLVEALIELGCTYRELAWRSNGEERIRLARDSEKALREAARQAHDKFTYREVDALVNLAWLHYYIGDKAGAQRILMGDKDKNIRSEVLELIPAEYLITREHGVWQVENPISWYWVQLGKADLLLGQIAFDEYEKVNNELKAQGVPPGERQQAWPHLKEAARLWTLALAYDSRYGRSFRDLKAGQRRIYANLDGLNVDEMNIVRESIAQTIKDYHIPEELRLMQHYVDERFGPPVTRPGSA